jgi:hypothetical protein
MPTWFLIVLLIIVAFAILMALAMGYSRRSAGGQNTTIIERGRQPDRRNTTVVED